MSTRTRGVRVTTGALRAARRLPPSATLPASGLLLGLTALHALPALTDIPPLRRMFPRLQGDGSPQRVALTFDDGPDEEGTPQVLDALRQLDVRATFFLLGAMLTRNPDLGRRLADEGHEVAVHGYDHRNLLRVGPRDTVEGICRAADLVETVTGTRPRWHRPPYGVLTGAGIAGARRAGLTTVLWGAWGRDWEPTATAATVAGTVGQGLRGGVTVLLHDSDCTSAPGSWRATVAALPAIAGQAAAAGLTLGPLAAHGLGR